MICIVQNKNLNLKVEREKWKSSLKKSDSLEIICLYDLNLNLNDLNVPNSEAGFLFCFRKFMMNKNPEKAPKKLSRTYEFVLLGYNMASLQMASELAEQEKNFCLVDCKHTGQQSLFKFIPELNKDIYTGLPFNTGFNRDFFSFESEFLGSYQTVTRLPLTFTKGKFHNFTGFGDKKPEVAITPYCENLELEVEKTPEDFFEEVYPLIEDHLFLDQQITDIQHSNGDIKKVVFNGQVEVGGQFFYFFDKLSFLFEKLKKPLKKTFRPFSKIKWFSSANLMIHHSQEPKEFEQDRVYLLMGLKNQPCFGMFSRVRGGLISRWQCFFPSELAESPESTAGVFKELKRQIQRAFPFFKIEESREFISLQDPALTDLGKSTLKNGKPDGFNNLFIYSPHLCNFTGWFHDRLLGHRAFKSLLL